MITIHFLAPHDPDNCCGCWDLVIDENAQGATWQCNDCGEVRDVVPPEEGPKA